MEKAKVAGKTPKVEKLEEGKAYAWCACGKSENQPWCNGAHQGSNFSPKIIKAEKSNTVAMCMCRQTKNPPYCDGSHMSLK
jgi:CDGSH iron-sulfur domain-containing protein 3